MGVAEVDKSNGQPVRGGHVVVTEKAQRRRFSRAYKLRILDEIEQCRSGEQGAVLRREGLYSSHLMKWRQQRAAGLLDGEKRVSKDLWQRLMELERENREVKEQLRQAKTVMAVQKKLSTLLGLDDGSESKK